MAYEHICEGTGCKFYVVWDFGYADYYSCTKIGESYHVDKYPSDCPFIEEMKKEDPNEVNKQWKEKQQR